MSLIRGFILSVFFAGVLGGCAGDAARNNELREERFNRDAEIEDESFFDLFRNQVDTNQNAVANRYLWRASLDILSFLPLETADPFSGVISTDWGRFDGTGTYRATVLVTEPALDARSLKVAAFRLQNGRAVPVSDEQNRQLEDAILTRARQMRIADAGRQ